MVSETSTLADVSSLYLEWGEHIAIVVDKSFVCLGVITSGDFNKRVMIQGASALSLSVTDVMNDEFAFAYEEDSTEQIVTLLKHFRYVPILNPSRKLMTVAHSGPSSEVVSVYQEQISDTAPTFIIAEIGTNHNGCVKRAKQMIDEVKAAGASCAKFQMRDLQSLYRKSSDSEPANLNTEYTLNLLERFELPPETMFELFDYCQSVGLPPLCTPWDLVSLQHLNAYGMKTIKISSADMTNHQLLEKAGDLGMSLILSTGMSKDEEIQQTVNLLKRKKIAFVLLHCNSTYPTPFYDIQLKFLETMKQRYQCLVGYSGHERGYEVPIAAVALGATVIEKHFTLDRSLEGVDHRVSLLPQEFDQMVQAIRNVESSLKTKVKRQLSQGEVINRANLAKSIYAAQPISLGQVIEEKHLAIYSPGVGLQPNRTQELVGRKATRCLSPGDAFYETDLEGHLESSRRFQIPLKYGIPVRFHDFKQLVPEASHLDFVEFHLSYQDLLISPGDYLQTYSDLGYIIHCPELFENDHVLDLCSPDKNYRQRSIEHFKKVIELSLELKKYFPTTQKPQIITNVGGFSQNFALSQDEVKRRLDSFENSLKEISSADIEILPQTMPPFPWHFGGQNFHNLFVSSESIVECCKRFKLKVCFDLSHSKLACNHLTESFIHFTEQVLPYSTHLHISDAKGLDGEGLQILTGDIDFSRVLPILAHNSDLTLIPEVWQGHENCGDGFWKALGIIEKLMVNPPSTP